MASSFSEFMGGRAVTSAQILVVIIVLVALILDGLDIQLLALVTPLILGERGISKAEFSPALAGAVIGMVIGTGMGGFLGDRWGRKRVFVTSVFVFGGCTAITSLCSDVISMAAVRVLSGLAFGAAYPNGIALVTEWLPRRVQSRAVGILAVAGPMGGMVAAGASFLFLNELGWRGMFVLCGVLTVVVGLTALSSLRETPDWLVRNGRDAEAARNAQKVLGGEVSAIVPESRDLIKRTIFTADLLRLNIGAPLCFFGLAFVNYSALSWMPTILTSLNMPLRQAISGSFLYNGLAIIGTMFAAFLIGKIGSRHVLLAGCTLSLVVVALLGMVLIGLQSAEALNDTHAMAALGLFGILGATHALGFSSLFAILAAGYPPEQRSTGIGFGLMSGRVGGILAILTSGILLEMGANDPTILFTTLSCLTLVSILAALLINRHCAPIGAPGHAI